MQPLVDDGWTVSVDFAQMPRWLSSRPDDTAPHPNGDWLRAWAFSPPVDLETWADLVGFQVSVYAEAGVHPWVGVWNELDWMFMGTTDDYLAMYAATSTAVKQADPDARVGGPSVSGFNAPKALYDGQWNRVGSSEAPLLFDLIDFVGSTPAPDLGLDHLLLDFVDFHFPAVGELTSLATALRAHLAGAGLDPDLPIRIGEWTYGQQGPVASSERAAASMARPRRAG